MEISGRSNAVAGVSGILFTEKLRIGMSFLVLVMGQPERGYLTILRADSANSWSLFCVISAAKSVIKHASPN
jgi:hypothetical protein